MAGASEVRAGKAYVEASWHGKKLDAGMRAAMAKLKSFAASVKSVGLKLMGLGAALKAPLAAAEGVFASVGAELAHMSKRTGVSVEALSQLSYAAEQSGVDMDELGNGIRKMQNKLGEAEQGNMEAAMSFAKLRISIAQLKGLSPEKQFELIADRMSQLRDPAQRAAMAIELFGKSGTELLPLLEQGGDGIRAMMKAADDLGLTMSADDAEAALSFTNSLKTLKDVVKVLAFNVGAALAPALQEIVGKVTGWVEVANIWIKRNGGILTSIAKIATGIMAAGAAIYGLGVAFGIAGTAAGFIATAVGVLTSPFVLIAGAVAGAVVAFVNFTDAGKTLWANVKAFLAPMLKTFENTFSGIKDAISGGNLGLAAKIAMLGVKVAMLQGVASLSQAVGGDMGDMIASLGSMLVNGDLSGAWQLAVAGLHTIWTSFSASVVSVFAKACSGVMHLWTSLLNSMSDYLTHDAAHGGWLSKMLPGQGKDPDFASTYRRKKSESDMRYLHELNEFNAKNEERKKKGLPELEMPDDLAVRKSEHEGHTDADAFEKRYSANVHKLNKGSGEDQVDSFLDDMNRAAQQNNDAAQGAWQAHIGAGGAGRAANNKALEDAQKALDAARREALNGVGKGPNVPDPNWKDHKDQIDKGQGELATAMKTSVAGTFNGMRAGQILGGSDRVVEHLKLVHKTLQKIDKNTKDTNNGPLVFGPGG
jgi:hypothetical protein